MAGYPSEDDLEEIAKWYPSKNGSYTKMMEYIKPLWTYADAGYWEEPEPGVYKISTAGWSGNEDIVSAMLRNAVFWFFCWYESKRGGHYLFKVPPHLW